MINLFDKLHWSESDRSGLFSADSGCLSPANSPTEPSVFSDCADVVKMLKQHRRT